MLHRPPPPRRSLHYDPHLQLKHGFFSLPPPLMCFNLISDYPLCLIDWMPNYLCINWFIVTINSVDWERSDLLPRKGLSSSALIYRCFLSANDPVTHCCYVRNECEHFVTASSVSSHTICKCEALKLCLNVQIYVLNSGITTFIKRYLKWNKMQTLARTWVLSAPSGFQTESWRWSRWSYPRSAFLNAFPETRPTYLQVHWSGSASSFQDGVSPPQFFCSTVDRRICQN